MIRLVGDVHGRIEDYLAIVKGSERSIQVGDMGLGFFGGSISDETLIEFHKNNSNHRFIRGNHDNPLTCRKSLGYIEDGTVENDSFLLGGAWSIDRQYRTEGENWWPDEEVAEDRLELLLATYAAAKPRVVVTHDAPAFATWNMFIRVNPLVKQRYLIWNRTTDLLQRMFELHQPEQWYFGHWHQTKTMAIRGTEFTCLGELDYKDVEL